MKWMFNLSYSAYSMYRESELQFYFQYIIKAEPDTEVYQLYGDAGQIIHSFSEEYLKDSSLDIEELFNRLWIKYNLDTKHGINNTKLDKGQYLISIYNVKNYIDLLKEKYSNIITEKKIEYISEEFKNLLIKGYIDFFIRYDNEILIVDWKTNASYDFKTHELQRKFYSWLCWKEYNIIPECRWIYTKKNNIITQKFTESEMLSFNEEILEFIKDIVSKGFDISKYSEGNWNNNIFNGHVIACRNEVLRRNNIKTIKYDIAYNTITLHDVPDNLNNIIDKKFSYLLKGHEFSPMFQSKRWDGKTHVYNPKKGTLPLGLLSKLQQLVSDYNEHFKVQYTLQLNKDFRADFGATKNEYNLGDWNNIFNTYLKQCREEVMRRETEKNKINIKINVSIKNNMLFFDDSLPEDIKNILVKKYKYKVAGCEFSELFKKRIWDGYKRFFFKNSIPLGFINDFKKLIKEYNEYFNMNVTLNFIDMRDSNIVNKVYDTKFKKNNYTLYDFQEDCVVKALENEIGIIYVGTGGGKTLISSEIIRRLNRRSLYIVNRIELGEQVRDNLEEILGVEVGLMSEGNVCIDKQITVASIQTIGAILKRNNENVLNLKKYLYNIGVTIMDEAQNIKDAGYYGILRKNLVNCKYIIGMSGTPFRT